MEELTQDERVTLIIEFEGGEISDDDFKRLFSHLIKTGLCWTLQGMYGRTAQNLIEKGIISKDGEIY